MLQFESSYDAEKKIWSGNKVKPYFNPKITIGEIIRESLQRNPQGIGQISVDTNVSLTNEKILLRSLKIASFLRKENLQTSDVAGVIAKNSENLAPLIFGLCFVGITINTLDASFKKDEIIGLFQYSKPKLIFCDSDIYPTVKETLFCLENEAPIYLVGDEKMCNYDVISVKHILMRTSIVEAYEFRLDELDDGRNHIAFILCSSGTTGPPKGVCLPHFALLQQAILRNFCESDVFLCFSSLYWLSGVIALIVGTISGATRIITSSHFTPELMLYTIEKYKVTKFLSPPSQLATSLQHPQIQQRDLSSLQIYFCGGSHVSSELCDEMKRNLPNGEMWIAYGMTEAGGICSLNSKPYKRGSVGKLADNITVKIVNKTGSSLGPHQKGEILIKTPHRFVGYYGRNVNIAAVVDSEDWIHSGDIGYFDDEGFLCIVGRTKDVLKYKGFQISPIEIESKLQTLHGIAQVCACGVPDPIAGDLPAVLIVRSNASNISEEEVHQFMRLHLSDTKQLRGGVYFVESIPMTASGKYQRIKAIDLATELYRVNINNACSSYGNY